MKVVLSIKPEFANKIFDGIKKYEFRKTIFKNEKVKTVIVYASSPVQQVIGEFEIEEIINHDIDTLWGLTQQFSGISKDYFYQYFSEKEIGYAIKIKKTKRYKQPKCLKSDYNLLPPQSFAYLQS
ncbi:MAG: ASCH domain-containing protein [Chitinophagaceae bacterium]